MTRVVRLARRAARSVVEGVVERVGEGEARMLLGLLRTEPMRPGPRWERSSPIFWSSDSRVDCVVVIARCSFWRRSRSFCGDCMRSFLVGVETGGGACDWAIRDGFSAFFSVFSGMVVGFTFCALPDEGRSDRPGRTG